MPAIITALGRLRQEDCVFQPVLHSKTLSQKNKNKNKRGKVYFSSWF
jgi:hypothetical protein